MLIPDSSIILGYHIYRDYFTPLFQELPIFHSFIYATDLLRRIHI